MLFNTATAVLVNLRSKIVENEGRMGDAGDLPNTQA